MIDDDLDLLLLIRRTLEFTAGWEVYTAASGAEGISAAGRLNPDVILVDVMMPELDGYEVCRRLKAEASTASVPVVLLTARREMDPHRVGESRATGVLYKPFQPAELARQIVEICR